MAYRAGSLKGGRCSLAMKLVCRLFVVPDRKSECRMERPADLQACDTVTVAW
jgi:hypothetical protein